MLSLIDATLQLEAAAAAKPALEAAAARAAFAAAQDALANAVAEESLLLLAACRRATDTVIEPRADAMRRDLAPVLFAAADDQWPDRIAAAASSWRREVGAALIAAMRGPIDRHAERLQELTRRFVVDAGQAFGVNLPEAVDVAPRVDVDTVRVDLADDPGALAMGVRQLRAHAPGAMGRRWRERARHERAIEDSDRLAGRLRYAAVQSVDRTARAWIREAEQASHGLSDALAGAVTRAELGAHWRSVSIAEDTEMRARVESVRHALLGG
jgi:hypothetical protein